MFQTTIIAAVLAIVTVGIHVAGFAVVLKTTFRLSKVPPPSALPIASQIMRMACFLIFVHASEIAVWVLFYRFAHCFPDREAAFYFSGVTYTTLGYGTCCCRSGGGFSLRLSH